MVCQIMRRADDFIIRKTQVLSICSNCQCTTLNQRDKSKINIGMQTISLRKQHTRMFWVSRIWNFEDCKGLKEHQLWSNHFEDLSYWFHVQNKEHFLWACIQHYKEYIIPITKAKKYIPILYILFTTIPVANFLAHFL